jgi:hypothetical protein
MKVQKVIFSCDLNPQYVGFWNSISKHTHEFLGLETQLICLGDPSGLGFSDKHGELKVVPLMSEYPGILQALWAKFWFTSQEPETVWMVGDLDLYPLQKKLFLNNCDHLPDDSYAHLSPAAYGELWHTYSPKIHPGVPGYYHVAKGKTFTEMLELHDTFREAIDFMYNSGRFGIKNQGVDQYAGETSRRIPHWGWFGAEEHYCSEILIKKKDRVINAGVDGWKRVDRSNGCQFDMDVLKSGGYVDMHSVRPYEPYAEQIEALLQIVRDHVR